MNTGKGFTLIELLIVIVLISVMTGMATLAIGTANPHDQQKLEAVRLAKLLELASQEAMVRSDVIGLEIFSQGYRFAVLKNNKWSEETKDMVLRPRQLSPQMLLSMDINQHAIPLAREPAQVSSPKPQIILTPDGDMAFFQINITLKNSSNALVVSNTQTNGLTVSTENEL